MDTTIALPIENIAHSEVEEIEEKQYKPHPLYLSTIIEQEELGSTILDTYIELWFDDSNVGLYKIRNIIHFNKLRDLLFNINDEGLYVFKHPDKVIESIYHTDSIYNCSTAIDCSKKLFDFIYNINKLFYDTDKLKDHINNLIALTYSKVFVHYDDKFKDLFGEDMFELLNDLLNGNNGFTKYVDYANMRELTYYLHGYETEQDVHKYVHQEYCCLIEAFLASQLEGCTIEQIREILCEQPSNYSQEHYDDDDDDY